MSTSKFIAFMLLLIFIALAWRFLAGVLLLALAVLMWVLLFKFCQGIAQGIREIKEKGV